MSYNYCKQNMGNFSMQKIVFLRYHLKDSAYLCGRQEEEYKLFSSVMNETLCQLLEKLNIIAQANLNKISKTVKQSQIMI